MSENRFSRKQERLLAALLTAPSVAEAARDAGMSGRQAHRLMQLPAFRNRYEQVRSECLVLAIEQAKAAMPAALACLKQIASDPKSPPGVRVTAASKLWDAGYTIVGEEMQAAKDNQRLTDLKRFHRELTDVEETKALPAKWQADDES